jgi:hypothetical protein
MRYFCQADVFNEPYTDSLFRYRTEADLHHEEYWDRYSGKWEPTTLLTKLLTGGDCTLVEITEQAADSMREANN